MDNSEPQQSRPVSPVEAEPPKPAVPATDAPVSSDSPAETVRPSTPTSDTGAPSVTRRTALQALSALGLGSAVFERALAAQVEQQQPVTAEMIQQAEWIAGLKLSEEQRNAAARAVQQTQRQFAVLRSVELTNDVPPALHFEVDQAEAGRGEADSPAKVRPTETAAPQLPGSEDDLTFLPVTELSALIRSRQISSVELTRTYLDRLHALDPILECVVSFTDDLAMRQARRADREIASGRYRGPLHGIPWGAKDLVAYPGYKTTWGAGPYQDQVLETKATVAQRLDNAGAVLIAKLTLGSLAWGDEWFGGKTRNPWDPRQGSSGSSAGSASTTAAGLVGFTLGSETLGSIVSPCRRCGTSGLRPTFGRVSRYGCMSLAWSMDKIGPIARSVEDCSLIFSVLHGADGLDPTAVDRPFAWPSPRSLQSLRVGYFESEGAVEERPELQFLKNEGVDLRPIQLPSSQPIRELTVILNTEAAAAFDQLTREDVNEGLYRWPDVFRQAQFVPAIEYLRANRIRTLLMREMRELMRDVDLYVGGNDLAITNLTGHPCVVMPGPLYESRGVRRPSSLKFTGRLFGETELLSVAHAYQQATDYHLNRPDVKALREAAKEKQAESSAPSDPGASNQKQIR